MAKQQKLKAFVKCKGRDFKGKWPKQYEGIDHVYVEDKYDGLRCIILLKGGKAKAYTSSGVFIPNAVEVCKAIESKVSYDAMFDGEMFCTDWNDTVSVMKTQTYSKELAAKAQIRLFDYMIYGDWKRRECLVPLKIRKFVLSELVKQIKNKRVQLITHVKARAKTKLMDYLLKKAAKQKREGIMIKDPRAGYAFRGSSPNWMKHKPRQDVDLKILDCLVGTEGKANGKRMGRLVVSGKIDGRKIKTRVGGGFKSAQRDMLWKMHKKGKLVGRFATFHHEGVTINGCLRFPQFVRLHEEK